ncbi:MAG: hypothetical protein ABSA12_12510 [Verrucomicrobiia bacterium]|jgi:hypothetical protein
MIQMVNGREVDIPTDSGGGIDSDVLRHAAGVPEDRPLILQMPDGNNQLLNPGEKLVVRPNQYFMDAPAHIRGVWP